MPFNAFNGRHEFFPISVIGWHIVDIHDQFTALLGADRSFEASETFGCALASVSHLGFGDTDYTVLCRSLGNLHLA